MTQIPIKNANGDIVNVEAPLAPGRVAAAASRPVVLSTEDFAALSALHTDLATTLAAYVDGLEGLIGTSNSSLSSILTALTSTIAGYVDGLETLVTGSNTKLDTIHTDLGTTLSGLLTDLKGYVDQLEGYVDGLETLVTSTNTKLDALHTDLIAATPAGTNLIGKIKTKFIEATASALTRPANTTAYTANDAVSDNATAGSVTPISLTVSDVNDDTVTIERLRLKTTDTGVQGKSFRVWLFQATPTVGGGDNAAFSAASTGFIGTLSGTFRATSDGAVAVLVPDEGARIIAKPVSGAATIKALMQTLDAFTPSANSTTLTLTAEGFQGAA
jgi:hypothetical protein